MICPISFLYKSGRIRYISLFFLKQKLINYNMKEKLCFVALDYDAEMEKAATTSEINRIYKLPDENIIVVGNERFRIPKILFKPYIIT